ncbi:MFS transporter [Spirobacillus cienkowskii]
MIILNSFGSNNHFLRERIIGKIIMLPYFLASIFYRLSNGCLILAFSWLMLNAFIDGEKKLFWIILTSFLPALIVAPIINFISNYFNVISIIVFGCLCIKLSVILIIIFNNYLYLLVSLNLFLWCIFFVLESSWEAWFTEISKSIRDDKIKQKFNSMTLTCSQAALMIGPLLVSPGMRINSKYGPFYISIILYFVTILLLIYSRFINNKKFIIKNFSNEKNISIKSIINKLPSINIFLILILIWPVLGMINMVLPIIGKNRLGGKVEYVAYLDFSIGLGMAISGILLSFFAAKYFFNYKGLSVLSILGFLSITSFCLFFNNLYILFILIFLFGMSFGGIRIIIRKYLVDFLTPSEVAKLIGSANAIGFPVVTLFSFLYSTSSKSELFPLLVFIMFILFAFIFSYNLGRKSENNIFKN